MLPAAGSEGLIPPMRDDCTDSTPESPPSASDESEFAEGESEFLEMWEAMEGVGVERRFEGFLGFEPGKPSFYMFV